jgi:hypothetical protein
MNRRSRVWFSIIIWLCITNNYRIINFQAGKGKADIYLWWSPIVVILEFENFHFLLGFNNYNALASFMMWFSVNDIPVYSCKILISETLLLSWGLYFEMSGNHWYEYEQRSPRPGRPVWTGGVIYKILMLKYYLSWSLKLIYLTVHFLPHRRHTASAL